MPDNKDRCYFCGKGFFLLEAVCVVSIAVKPKGRPHRWKRIGFAHEECVKDPRDCWIDKYKSEV